MSEGDGISNRSGPASAAEPSMEEILASIRRILAEEEGSGATNPEHEDELLLDSSMRVPGQDLPATESATEAPTPEPAHYISAEPPPTEHFAVEPVLESAEPAAAPPLMPEDAIAVEPSYAFGPPPAPDFAPLTEPLLKKEEDYHVEEQVQGPEGLVGDQAVSEITNSIGALVRSVSAERSATVGRAGVTIEDIVREEVKPVLKAWLDTHLPSLVERVVRAEINRVMDRAQG